MLFYAIHEMRSRFHINGNGTKLVTNGNGQPMAYRNLDAANAAAARMSRNASPHTSYYVYAIEAECCVECGGPAPIACEYCEACGDRPVGEPAAITFPICDTGGYVAENADGSIEVVDAYQNQRRTLHRQSALALIAEFRHDWPCSENIYLIRHLIALCPGQVTVRELAAESRTP